MLQKHLAHPRLWLDNARTLVSFRGLDGRVRTYGYCAVAPEVLRDALVNHLCEVMDWSFLQPSGWDLTIPICFTQLNADQQPVKNVEWSLEHSLREIARQSKTFNSQNHEIIHYQTSEEIHNIEQHPSTVTSTQHRAPCVE